jgi:competence protein ComEC
VNWFVRLVSQNLLCAAACAFAAGIAVSFSPPAPLLYGTLLTIAVLAVVMLRTGRRIAAGAAILVFFVGIGILYGRDCGRPPPDPSHIYNWVEGKKEAVLLGAVAGIGSTGEDGSRVEIIGQAAMFKDESALVPRPGRISLTLKGPWPEDIGPGDRVLIRAVLSRPASLQTAGSFDYVRYLAEKDIFVTGIVASPLYIRKISSSLSFSQAIFSAIERARMQIGAAIDTVLPPATAGIYKAILLGDRSGLDSGLQEKFKGAGCMHILALICII